MTGKSPYFLLDREDDDMSNSDSFQASHTPFDPEKYGRSPYEIKRTEIIRDLLPDGQGARALDVGCGPGYFSHQLSMRGWSITAIDTDASNLEFARPFVQEALRGDALTVLPHLQNESYRLALALEIIEHMPEERGRNLLKELARVLEKSGKLIISTPNKHSPEGLGGHYWSEKIRHQERWDAWDPTHVKIYSANELLALLRDTGFSIEKVTGYHYRGRLPVIGRWRLPLEATSHAPLNRFGFNVIIECRRG